MGSELRCSYINNDRGVTSGTKAAGAGAGAWGRAGGGGSVVLFSVPLVVVVLWSAVLVFCGGGLGRPMMVEE